MHCEGDILRDSSGPCVCVCVWENEGDLGDVVLVDVPADQCDEREEHEDGAANEKGEREVSTFARDWTREKWVGLLR